MILNCGNPVRLTRLKVTLRPPLTVMVTDCPSLSFASFGFAIVHLYKRFFPVNSLLIALC